MPATRFSLDWVLDPISPDTFFNEYFERRPLLVKRGDPGYYSTLLSFADIDHVVTTMGLTAPEITVTKNTDHAAKGTDSDAAPATDSDADAAPPIGPEDYANDAGRIDPIRVAQLFSGTVFDLLATDPDPDTR